MFELLIVVGVPWVMYVILRDVITMAAASVVETPKE
jgi:hypothetical protein